jgi:ribosomal protein S7
MFGYLIKRGNKLKAFNFMSNLRYSLKEKGFVNFFYTFLIACLKIVPKIIFKQVKKGKLKFDLPMPINEEKKFVYVNKLALGFLKKKYGIITLENVVDVITSALENKGSACKIKKNMHLTAIKNKYLLKYMR